MRKTMYGILNCHHTNTSIGSTKTLQYSSLMGQQLGHWIIEKRLGKGGAAAVYLAYHRFIPERKAAIKVLHTSSDQTEQERFHREATAISRLEHPNIVKLIDFGYEEKFQTFFMVQELLQGYDLRQLIKRCGPLPKGLIWTLVQQICAGLNAVHQAGMIHRDLKPSNLFLLPEEAPFPLVKLLDFGIAKYTDSKRTEQLAQTNTPTPSNLTGESIIGTPKYLSPEQVDVDQKVSAQTDIYALGAMLYELFTGKVPIHKKGIIPQAMALVREERPKAGQFRAELAGTQLETLLHQMVQKNPNDRPATVAQVLDKLGLAMAQFDDPLEQNMSEIKELCISTQQMSSWHQSLQTEEDTCVESPAIEPSSGEKRQSQIQGYPKNSLPSQKREKAPLFSSQSFRYSIFGMVGLLVCLGGYHFLSNQPFVSSKLNPYAQCIGDGLRPETKKKLHKLIQIYRLRTLQHFRRKRETHYAWTIGQMSLSLGPHIPPKEAVLRAKNIQSLRIRNGKNCKVCFARLTGQREHSNFVLAWATIALLMIDPKQHQKELHEHLQELLRLQTKVGFWMIHPMAQMRTQHASIYPTVLSFMALHLAQTKKRELGMSDALFQRIKRSKHRAIEWLASSREPKKISWKSYPDNRENQSSQGATAMVLYAWAISGERQAEFKKMVQRWAAAFSMKDVPKMKGHTSQDFHPDVRIYLKSYQIHDATRYLKLPWLLIAISKIYPYLALPQRLRLLAWTEKAILQLSPKYEEDWRIAMLLFGMHSLECNPQPKKSKQTIK